MNSHDKEGVCPKCGKTILVPDGQIVADLLRPVGEGEPPEVHTAKRPYNLTFLGHPKTDSPSDLPPDELPASTDDFDTAFPYTQVPMLGSIRRDDEPPPQRKLPWIIDIFLFPVNASGLSIIAIVTVLPFILHAATKFLSRVTMVFPPAVVLLILVVIIHILLGIVLFCYIWWYFSECIRDSALGALRAPETTGTTPGFGELICVIGRIIACAAVALAPAILYYACVGRIDRTLWILYGCGAFVFPMTWLAVTMFDSIGALNPILIIPSILSTFPRYLALTVFYYMPAFAVPMLIHTLPRNWLADHLLRLIGIYLMMVTCHLLGRFYFRAQEKLNWAV
ncbi:MAG: hypothetical protein ACYS8Z_14525 [Planctomycetota bacterium]|jgi:hypothetical protein